MSDISTDSRADRLYQLLPAIYRMSDAGQKYALKALLRVISEQVNVVEDDIRGLYDNWFIETADDWAVPYIADLIGYRPVLDAGTPSGDTTREGRALNRYLIPRREVAATIRARRRKGTLGLLETLANDVAGWPAYAVEFFKLLGWNQHVNHLHLSRARTVDVRALADVDLLGTPFDDIAHSIDVRRSSSRHAVGRYNIETIAMFIWRLQSYPVTHAPAYCAENAGPQCYTFSVLGQCEPLFVKPAKRAEGAAIAGELDVPTPVRRLEFDRDKGSYYGADKSFAIWAEGWAGLDPDQPVPVEWILPADLTDWQYVPPQQHIALDPELGRFAFPPSQLPRKGVRVTYRYGFSSDIGGGEYKRPILDPAPRDGNPGIVYRVGRKQTFQRIGDALDQYKSDHPRDAVIELTDSAVYVEPVYIQVPAGASLQLRAANGARPVIRLLDWQTDLPDALSVTLATGSRFTMDGLLVTGRPVQVNGPDASSNPIDSCVAEFVIRHCTLVPGWGIDCDCQPKRPAEPSIEINNIGARVRIEHSILGSILVNEDETRTDPTIVSISDSILDSTNPAKEALSAPGGAIAYVTLTVRRTTVFGIVNVHSVELAEDSIFNHCVNVARRQLGCVRFCYVPAGCRTPRRYRCQPDLVTAAVRESVADETLQQADIAAEGQRVRPQFTAALYGKPGYAQLAATCAVEISRGAGDESEMGVFHDLFQPQRETNLATRLAEYTPAGIDVGIVHVT